MSRQTTTLDDAWTKVKRRRVATAQNWNCYWCGFPMCEVKGCGLYVSLDHLVPRHNGGLTRPGNYVAAHIKCNADRHPELNRRKHSEPALVATTGETKTESPFAILIGRIK